MKNGRILMAMQSYPGDLAQAEELLRVCADLTLQANHGKPSPHADLLMALRWDCPVNQAFLRTISSAFGQVRMFRCRNRVVGWPQGCNNLAQEVFRYFVGKQQDGVWNYSGLMLCEADSVPLAADFLARVHGEWRATEKPILGAFVGAFPGEKPWSGSEHVNGNMVIADSFASTHPDVLSRNPPIAWDAYWRREFRANAKASLQIHSDYQMGSEKNPWDGDCERLWKPVEHAGSHPLAGVAFKPCWVHGPKDGRALACARERLLVQRVNVNPVDATV